MLVDTSGPALLDAARAGADVLKPNLGEALAATGEDTPLAAARALLGLGAGTVRVLPRGRTGCSACTAPPAGMLPQAAPGRGDQREPHGAGDSSSVAVLAARLLVDADPLPDVLRHAVAVSASAVTCPVAGQIDPGLAAQLLPTVSI